MLDVILRARDQVLCEKPLSFEEAGKLLQTPPEHIPYLGAVANEVRIRFKGQEADLCALTNARSGACSEDCKFCSQSSRYRTDSPLYALVGVEKMVEQAKEAEMRGATAFCIVTSGRGQTHEPGFDAIVKAVGRIFKETHLKIDCSLGFLTPGQVRRLKEAGLYRNNHNLETSRSYFKQVCTTHSYEDRVRHVRMLRDYGILSCSGGIIGMGETPLQRLELAFALRDLCVNCVPINILNPRPGTPFADLEPLQPLEVIKAIALFRLILPRSTIKIAGGREVNLRDLQAVALQSGANGLVLGNYLTTMGRSSDEDLCMLRDLGFDVPSPLKEGIC